MSKERAGLAWKIAPQLPRCETSPSKRSTAKCEMPPGHDGLHTGRTAGGYWKSWADRRDTEGVGLSAESVQEGR